MRQDLQNYTPSNPEYVLDDDVREEFPLELDFIGSVTEESLTCKRDVMRYVGKNFSATFPDGEYVTRKMDEHEKSTIRKDYCVLVENLLPERKRQLEEALEEAKRLKKEAEELYASALQEINTMAAEVRMGTVDARLKGSDTFCIALAGYYLYYTWNETTKTCVLAKATPANDSSLWSSDEKNREMMLHLFGAEFPESERNDKNDGIDAF